MSEIRDNWIAGKGFPGTLVIDGHTHLSGYPSETIFRNPQEAAKHALEEMDTCGVDAIIMLPFASAVGIDIKEFNNLVLDVHRICPDRLLGFVGVNPHDKIERIIDELKRMYDYGFKGIKLRNDPLGYRGDGASLMAVYEFAAERSMLILNHSWSQDVIEKIARDFLNVNFIFGHYQPSQDQTMREFSNVYASIWSIGSLGHLDRAVKNGLEDKLLLGSDSFMNPMPVGLAQVACGRMSDEQKRKILGLNMANLLKIDVSLLGMPS